MKFYLRTGEILDFSKKEIGKFDITSLIDQLGKEKRFYGTIDWSVLQHSLACYVAGTFAFPDNTLLQTHLLLHDLHEALIHDVPSFVKTEDFRNMEDQVSGKLLKSLRVDLLGSEDRKYLKMVDSIMAYVEAFNFGSVHLADAVYDDVYGTYGEEENIHYFTLVCSKAFETIRSYGSMFNEVVIGSTPTIDDEGEVDVEEDYVEELKPEIVAIFNEVIRLY